MASPLPNSLAVLHEVLASHLAEISKLFVSGMKLTILVRNPERPDGSQDVMLTDDKLPEAIRALEIFRAREAGERQ